MKKLDRPVSTELEIKGSRFLAEAIPVDSQEAARAALRERKARHADATHVVHAFAVGSTHSVLGSSDDGEPAGTAGRPMLEVLKGSGITDVLLTVTRWFGGTLLGTGGLVKAYSESAKRCLLLAEAASSELVDLADFSATLAYDSYERAKRELSLYDVRLESEDFSEAVSIRGKVPQERAEAFASRLTDLCKGRCEIALSR
jgi:uncharacterized YigZ family protein